MVGEALHLPSVTTSSPLPSVENLFRKKAASLAGEKLSPTVIAFIRNATNRSRFLHVAELRPGGSSARNTHLVDADADMVLIKGKPNDFEYGKRELKRKVDDIERELKAYLVRDIHCEFQKSSACVVQCIIDGVEVDVVCAWLLSDSESNSLSREEREYFSASRTHEWTEITRERRTEVNEVTRIFKNFVKRAFSVGGSGTRPHPLSCSLEALVLRADDALLLKKEGEEKKVDEIQHATTEESVRVRTVTRTPDVYCYERLENMKKEDGVRV